MDIFIVDESIDAREALDDFDAQFAPEIDADAWEDGDDSSLAL